MFGPAEDDEPCPSCSFFADSFNGAHVHLANRDTAFVVVSRAPYEKLQAFKKRMGWTFEWVSAGPKNEFPFDTHSAVTEEQLATTAEYNFKQIKPWGTELPGASVFFKDDKKGVFHTYSCYGRGLDILNTTYNLLDLTPKGRDEQGPFKMSWVRRRDEYGQPEVSK